MFEKNIYLLKFEAVTVRKRGNLIFFIMSYFTISGADQILHCHHKHKCLQNLVKIISVEMAEKSNSSFEIFFKIRFMLLKSFKFKHLNFM